MGYGESPLGALWVLPFPSSPPVPVLAVPVRQVPHSDEMALN
jgi:hypothetical protein